MAMWRRDIRDYAQSATRRVWHCLIRCFAGALCLQVALTLAQDGPPGATATTPSAPSGPVASISLPYDGALIRAKVPVFGTADAPDFKQYRVEFGEGLDPTEWKAIQVSSRRQPYDPWKAGEIKWDPNSGAKGNLATWDTGLTSYSYVFPSKDNLNGVHTLRVVVETLSGRMAEARIHVNVAREVTRLDGGIAESRDNQVFLTIPPFASQYAFLLVALTPVDEQNPALIDIKPPKDLVALGRTYELQPPGIEFLKPASFRMHFDFRPGASSNVAAIVRRAGIYAYEPLSETWRRLPGCRAYADRGEVTTELTTVTPYLAYYAVLADTNAPEPPTLTAGVQSTELPTIALRGAAEPLTTVEVLRGDSVCAATQVDDEGEFTVKDVLLNMGTNIFAARAIDSAGNVGVPGASCVVQRRMHPPRTVTEMVFVGKQIASHGDTILVKLVGEDSDPAVNVAPARISSSTDRNGFELALIETGPETGIFTGTISVGASTDATAGRIGTLLDGETILAVPLVDPRRRASLMYRDRTPPDAPWIVCTTHPSLVQNTFEATTDPLGDWRNVGGKVGATLSVGHSAGSKVGATPSGCFLKLTKEVEKGHFGAVACSHTFDVRRYPLISFDYLIPVDVKLEMELDERRLVRFNDDAEDLPLRLQRRERVASLPGIVSDGTWRHTELNLAAAMSQQPRSADTVREIRFINWDKTAYRKLEFGRSGPRGASWCIDNFRIVGYGGREAVFSWVAEDETSIAGYSYVLDRNAETVPEAVMMGQVTNTTYKGLADGHWYFHVRARDAVGNWGPANHHMIFVDGTPPVLTVLPLDETACSDGSVPVRVHVDDGDGSGVNASTVRFRVAGRSYGVGAVSVTYDAATQVATFDPASEDPRMVLFNAGSRFGDPIQVEAADCAGHRAEILFRPTLSAAAASPLCVTPVEPDGSNCWYVTAPRIKCEVPAGSSVSYAWDVAPDDDEWFHKGNSINRLMATVKDAAGRTRRYAKAFQLDATIPHVAVHADSNGRIVLEHDDYVRAPGGLNCRLYRTATMDAGSEAGERETDLDLSGVASELLSECRAARWRGILNVLQTGIYTFQSPQRDHQTVVVVLLDGATVMQRDARGTSSSNKTQSVLLKRGLHPIEVSSQASEGAALPVRLLWKSEGQGGDASPRNVPADALLALRSLARIRYRWAGGVEQTYTGPVSVPDRVRMIYCHAEDEAGHRSEEQAVNITAVLAAGRQQIEQRN